MPPHAPDPDLPSLEELTSSDERIRNRAWAKADHVLRPRLMGNLRKKGIAEETVRDISQQVLSELIRSLSSSPVDDKTQVWPRMFQIAQRRFFNHLRHQGRHPEDSWAEPPEPDIEIGALASPDADALVACIEKLKPELRDLVTQHYWDDIKQTDLAKSNRIPEGTVNYKLSTARRLLKACVEASRPQS